jgi:hypothetical protein
MNILVYNPTSTVTKMTRAASHVLWDRAVAYRTRRLGAPALNGTARVGWPLGAGAALPRADAAYTQRYAL